MKSTGIIVEYNPFHNGHKLHIEKSKEITNSDVIIAVMSGNFVQRGEPALIDKWKRAEIAILNGVDLILELPVFYSTQSAEIFALGAIHTLSKLKVDNLVFGSEIGDVLKLEKLVNIILSDEFNLKIKNEMKLGKSYPNAMALILSEYFDEEILSPNNILGIEYIKAIKKLNSNLKVFSIKREKVGFYEDKIVENISSASYIRKLIVDNKIDEIKNLIPEKGNEILINSNKIFLKEYYELLRYKIINSYENLKDIQDMEIGLENRIYKSAIKNNKFDDFFNDIITKRYTISRIKRILIHILLDIKKIDTNFIKENLPFIKILAFNKKGAKYLKKINKNLDIPLINNVKDSNKFLSKDFINYFNIQEKSDFIYSIIMKNYLNLKQALIFFEKGSF